MELHCLVLRWAQVAAQERFSAMKAYPRGTFVHVQYDGNFGERAIGPRSAELRLRHTRGGVWQSLGQHACRSPRSRAPQAAGPRPRLEHQHACRRVVGNGQRTVRRPANHVDTPIARDANNHGASASRSFSWPRWL